MTWAMERTVRCARADANLTPYEQSWSLGVERELPGNVVLNVEYIGKKGTHLPFSGANQLNILGPLDGEYSHDGCRPEQSMPNLDCALP